MRGNLKRAVTVVAVAFLMLTMLSLYELPGGVRFAAPHKSRLGALAGRISLNSRQSARWVDRILHLSLPSVYACPNALCDGTKAVADPTGVAGQPCCYFDANANCLCPKITCAYVGGNHLCDGPYPNKCAIAHGPTITCNYANKVGCQ